MSVVCSLLSFSGSGSEETKTITAINGAEDSAYKDALVSYATGLKGVAAHYAEYAKSGSQSELDDYNALNEQLESLWQEVENSK